MDSDRLSDYSESRAVLIGTSEYRDKRFPGAAVTALLDHEVDAADVFTTTPEIETDGLVVLADPRGCSGPRTWYRWYTPALQADPRIAGKS